jgi:cell division protein FtsB
VNPRQFIITLYVVLFAGLGVGAGVLLLDAWAEYKQLKLIEASSKQRLAAEEARLKAQQKVLEQLQTDPTYVEKVLRERWGYARPGDVITRFPPQ